MFLDYSRRDHGYVIPRSYKNRKQYVMGNAEGRSVSHMLMGDLDAVTEACAGEENQWARRSHDA